MESTRLPTNRPTTIWVSAAVKAFGIDPIFTNCRKLFRAADTMIKIIVFSFELVALLFKCEGLVFAYRDLH
eukprot:4378743-Karenia_brevis.AAC.1